MATINHILVPTDGSEGSLNAARFAGSLANAFGAKVSVLMVQGDDTLVSQAWGYGNFPFDSPDGMKTVEEIRTALEQHVKENELQDTSKALGALNIDPEIVSVWGHPSEEILKFSEENGVDLIVIGSHGRSALKRAFLGSVSQAVANQATCPVTVVK
ncbi:MAG: universal stress protein [Pseudomonadales bacterium]|nr:universal stress protein [Pseudomonadales bacterium]